MVTLFCSLPHIIYFMLPFLSLQKELIGKRLLDVVHPKDVPVLREELAPAHARSSSPSTRFVFKASEGAASASPRNTFATTCRRAFFCRFKTKSTEETSNDDTSLLDTQMHSNPFQLVDDTDKYSISTCDFFHFVLHVALFGPCSAVSYKSLIKKDCLYECST